MHNELLWAHMPDEEFTSYWSRRGCGSGTCGMQYCAFPDCLPDAVRDRFRSIADKEVGRGQPNAQRTGSVLDRHSTGEANGRTGPDSEALW